MSVERLIAKPGPCYIIYLIHSL